MRSAIAVTLFAALSAAPAFAEERDVRFDQPLVDGAAVDWCERWGEGCGRPAANAFCRERGFRRAVYYELYRPGRTFIASSNDFCTGADCTGFAVVICRAPREAAAPDAPPQPPAAEPPPPATPPAPGGTQRFDYPRIQGYGVDWCRDWGTACGWGGAHAFCRAQGFQRALDWSVHRPGATYVAGAGRLCQGPNCAAFTHVTCQHPNAPERGAPPAAPPGAQPGAPPPGAQPGAPPGDPEQPPPGDDP